MKLGSSKKIGKKFGRLLVIETVPRYWKTRRYTYYKCKCDCGKIIITSLINTNSCGCFQKNDVTERNRKQLGWATQTSVWHYYKRNAMTRKLSWELTKEQFLDLIKQKCYYCKVEPWNLIEKSSGDWAVVSGIDRKDNNIGYIINNCVPCCKICNRAKLNLDYSTFIKWLNVIKNK